MYFIRPSYCPYCSRFAESHYYDNDEPITDINGNPGLFTYRGPALIQELQVVIQYCDDCAKGPDATRYLKLGIPMDKFLDYCNDEEYARCLKKIIAKLLDRSRRKGEKGEIIHRPQIERDNQHFLQTMVTLQADGKRLLRGEDLGRRKRKEETAKRLHRWLSGIGRGNSIRVDEKSFWVGVPDREGDEDENDAHESVPHEEAPHEEDPHDNHAHENDNHAHGNGHHTHGSNNHAHETDGHGDEAHKGEPHEGEAHHDQPHADDTHADDTHTDEPREDEPDKDDADDAVTTKMSSLEFGH